jgi:hypothetical protein
MARSGKMETKGSSLSRCLVLSQQYMLNESSEQGTETNEALACTLGTLPRFHSEECRCTAAIFMPVSFIKSVTS